MRSLVTVLSALVVLMCAPLQRPKADEAVQLPRVGFVAPQGRSLPLFDAFRKGLADLGYVEGKEVQIEARFADGRYERFPEIFDELVRLHVDLIAVTGAVTARAAMKSVTDIPIVFSVVVDPVADKVVETLQRPGGHATGVTSFDPQQATRQLEMLRQVIPALKRVAILGDQGVSEALLKNGEEQARALGLRSMRFRLSAQAPDLEGAFVSMKAQNADALLVLEEPVPGVYAKTIAEMAAENRLPTMMAPSRVAAGGLLAYGTSQTEAIHRMTTYVVRILEGANPAELPVDTLTRYELIVNEKTARQIGVSIPAAVLEPADRVIR